MNFPRNELDNAETVFGLLGGFWSQLYQGRELGLWIARGRCSMEQQSLQDVNELGLSLGCRTLPPLHTVLWTPLVLREDERQVGHLSSYGDGQVYGQQPGGGQTYVYGGASDRSAAWPAPDGLKECQIITSGVTSPVLIMAEGVEFEIDHTRGVIVFRDDPFGDPLVAQNTSEDGLTQEITLWAFRGRFDVRNAFTQYGYALGLDAASGPNYVALLNAIILALSNGPSLATVHKVLAALCDVPLALEDETVEEVFTDLHNLVVVTDQNVYKFSSDSTALVSAGSELKAGQPIVDTIRLDMANGSVPSGLTSLELPKDFLTGVTTGPLTFANSQQSITVTTGVSGKTKITFPLTGDTADITAFFNTMHTRGVAAGATLANYLDLRAQPQTAEPDASNLPTTLNPAEFLFENVLRGNLLLIRRKTGRFGPNAIDLSPETVLRRVLPPHLAMLVVDTA